MAVIHALAIVDDLLISTCRILAEILEDSMESVDFSIKDMFLHADPVVQAVMVILFLASLFTWIFIIEKYLILRRLRQDMQSITLLPSKATAVEIKASAFPPMARDIIEAGLAESKDAVGAENRADIRERIERAMRDLFFYKLQKAGNRTTFLASVGASSPFIGLFGTVWGIMHSFAGIAASGETTLSVIAPGIAEALFATAMGLVAAIPAVLGYNKIMRTIKEITGEALYGIGRIGNILAREFVVHRETRFSPLPAPEGQNEREKKNREPAQTARQMAL